MSESNSIIICSPSKISKKKRKKKSLIQKLFDTGISRIGNDSSKENVLNEITSEKTEALPYTTEKNNESVKNDIPKCCSPVHEDNKITSEKPETLPKTAGNNVTDMEIDESVKTDIPKCYSPVHLENVIVVVDTNVLLNDRSVLDELRLKMLYGKSMKIVIPHIVMKELDGLKGRGKGSQNSIKWYNSHLKRNDSCIIGESYEDYLQSLSESPAVEQTGDDSILEYCLCSKKKNNTVHLLTNDINLRNRALVSKISSYSSDELRNKLSSSVNDASGLPKRDISENVTLTQINEQRSTANSQLQQKNNSPMKNTKKICCTPNDIKKIKKSIVTYLGKVLHYGLKSTYDDLWRDIVLFKPPWSCMEVLKCFEKHWLAVFVDKLPQHILNVIKDIRVSISKQKYDDVPKKLNLLYHLFKKEPYKSLVKQSNDEFVICSPKSKGVSSTKNVCSIIPPVEITLNNVCKPAIQENQCNKISDITQVILDVGNQSHQKIQNFQSNGVDSYIVEDLNVFRSLLVSYGFLIISIAKGEDGSYACRFDELTRQICKVIQIDVREFSFSDCDLKTFGSSEEGKTFIQLCITEFETLIHVLDNLLQIKSI